MNTEKRAKEIEELSKQYRKAKTDTERKLIRATMALLDLDIKKEMGWTK